MPVSESTMMTTMVSPLSLTIIFPPRKQQRDLQLEVTCFRKIKERRHLKKTLTGSSSCSSSEERLLLLADSSQGSLRLKTGGGLVAKLTKLLHFSSFFAPFSLINAFFVVALQAFFFLSVAPEGFANLTRSWKKRLWLRFLLIW